MTQAFPLAWPAGWPRAGRRKVAHFGTSGVSDGRSYRTKRDLTMEDAFKRLYSELERLGVRHPADDSVVSTNLRLNLSGRPRGDQGEPGDPGVAVYWQAKGKPSRVIAVDAYTRVRDNIAAIAATLEAMRAIERHGGAQVMERAFTGFDALPAPKRWHEILGVSATATRGQINEAFRRLAGEHHPDRAGGSHERMAEISRAREDGMKDTPHD